MSERSSNVLLIAVIAGWAVLIVALLFVVLRPGGATTAACPAPTSATPTEFHVHLGNDDFNTQQADTVNDTVNDTSSSRVTDSQTDSTSGTVSESGLRPISVVVWNKPVNAQGGGDVSVDNGSEGKKPKTPKPKPTPEPTPEPTPPDPDPTPDPTPDPSPTEGP